MIEFELPFPPSINHYYRHAKGRTYISDEGKIYRDHVILLTRSNIRKTFEGRLAVEIQAFPPDRRARDIDNMQKALLDALEHAQVFKNDSQIDDLRIRRRERFKGGRVLVRVAEITEGG